MIIRWYGLEGSSDEKLAQLTRLREAFRLDTSKLRDIEFKSSAQPNAAPLLTDQTVLAPEKRVSTMIGISKT